MKGSRRHLVTGGSDDAEREGGSRVAESNVIRKCGPRWWRDTKTCAHVCARKFGERDEVRVRKTFQGEERNICSSRFATRIRDAMLSRDKKGESSTSSGDVHCESERLKKDHALFVELMKVP